MLKISNLSFTYQGEPIFQNLNLSLSEPEVVAVIGDNGVGKTTLLRLIAEELKPDDGSVRSYGTIGFLRQTQDDLPEKSGGEKTQIRLVELFRQNPEILLLDEPTNNLDSEGKSWLLRNLRGYYGLIVIVSHDRNFLTQVAERIIYLHDGEVENFPGSYQKFCEYQVQKRQQQLQNYEQTQHEKKKLERQLKFARDRGRKSNRRSYNKMSDESRLHYNGKRMAAQNSAGQVIRATHSKLEHLNNVKKPLERKFYAAEVHSELLHDKKLLEVTDLAKSYGKKNLFQNLSFEVRTGERVRVMGRNGSGKSTLFRIILEQATADNGKIWQAPNLKLGYISQDVTGFDLEKSFLAQNEDLDKTAVCQAATTMDFAPRDMKQPLKNLSRGQMTKLSILKLILQPLDLVILDEITNHLDIRAQENVEGALKNYRGALLVATHDEAFAAAIGFEKMIELNQYRAD